MFLANGDERTGRLERYCVCGKKGVVLFKVSLTACWKIAQFELEQLGNLDDWLTYVLRNLTTHRAEIAVDRHNEDIQQGVPAKPSRIMRVVVTYNANCAQAVECHRETESDRSFYRNL